MNGRSLLQLQALFITVSVILCSEAWPASLPDAVGAFQVGLNVVDAVDVGRDNRELRTLIWYPVEPEYEGGEPLRYYQNNGQGPDWSYESPYWGGYANAPAAGDAPLPVIALSHGATAWPVQLAMLGESLATHGYVVVAPRHTGNAWGTADTPFAETEVNRPLDISFSLDLLASRHETEGDLLQGKVNSDLVGLVGYSLGGPTIQDVVAGVEGHREPDPRPKAALFLDGVGTIDDLKMPVLVARSNDTLLWPELETASPFHQVGFESTHHWSFGLNNCQYRDKLVAAGIDLEVVNDVIGANDWIGCAERFHPPEVVQETTAQFAIAFFEQYLRNDDQFAGSLEPDVLEETVTGEIFATLTGGFREGLNLLVTDPLGRRIGFDLESQEWLNEVGDSVLHEQQGNRDQRISIPSADLVPGEYTLSGVAGDRVSGSREALIEFGFRESKGPSLVWEKQELYTAEVERGAVLPDLVFSFFEQGDQNKNSRLDAGDVDLLPNENDRIEWVHDLANSYFGDSNLDGEFNSSDLVAVFAAGEYEDGTEFNSGWATGDWDGDGDFTSSDIVLAFSDGGYEQGPRVIANAVPEPTSATVLLAGLLGTAIAMRNRASLTPIVDSAQARVGLTA